MVPFISEIFRFISCWSVFCRDFFFHLSVKGTVKASECIVCLICYNHFFPPSQLSQTLPATSARMCSLPFLYVYHLSEGYSFPSFCTHLIKENSVPLASVLHLVKEKVCTNQRIVGDEKERSRGKTAAEFQY